jgi:hypothetical protein
VTSTPTPYYARTNLSWILKVGHEDAAVTVGALGAALVMAVAAVADLDAEGALVVCVVAGLTALGMMSAYATAHHRRSTQVMMSASAVVLGAVIVFLENTL